MSDGTRQGPEEMLPLAPEHRALRPYLDEVGTGHAWLVAPPTGWWLTATWPAGSMVNEWEGGRSYVAEILREGSDPDLEW